MSLYIKYRPVEFNEIVGNSDTVMYLEEVIKDKKNIPHVFLFHGPTGCGKTTMARILAKELGATGINIKEINSADFRGIDTVRDMIRSSRYQSIGGGNRVWIIDEVHQQTTAAQTALLKLLEDTPSNAYYILCTTEPDKLLPTIKGRTIQLGVNPLKDSQMFNLLGSIVKRENAKVKGVVYEQIIEDSFGLPRNALQILDKVLKVHPDQQLKMAKESAAQHNASIELCRVLLLNTPWKKVSTILKGLKDQDVESIRRHVLGYAQSTILSHENDKAALILEEFVEPFYNSGFPGLVFACYSIIKG